jgi:predicted metal-dependent phosphoesterase TrpH
MWHDFGRACVSSSTRLALGDERERSVSVERRVRVDMHTHSEYSPDSRTPLAEQARAIRDAGLDVVCATDHNTIEGAVRLRELADGFRVIVGEEISTRDGEMIGLFLERVVPRDLSGEDTIARIRDQGGLVVIPHPFSVNRRYHIRRAALDRLRASVDAIEVFNAREAFGLENRRAAAYAHEHGVLASAGSDAHRAAEIGNAYVDIPEFAGRDDFLAALAQAVVHGRLAGTAVHFFTRYDRVRKWLRRRTASASER